MNHLEYTFSMRDGKRICQTYFAVILRFLIYLPIKKFGSVCSLRNASVVFNLIKFRATWFTAASYRASQFSFFAVNKMDTKFISVIFKSVLHTFWMTVFYHRTPATRFAQMQPFEIGFQKHGRSSKQQNKKRIILHTKILRR